MFYLCTHVSLFFFSAGSVYSAIYQAFIDIRNLSELLFESPDIVDREGAQDIPILFATSSSSTSHQGLDTSFSTSTSTSSTTSALYDAHLSNGHGKHTGDDFRMVSIGSVSDDGYYNTIPGSLEDGLSGHDSGMRQFIVCVCSYWIALVYVISSKTNASFGNISHTS